MLEEHRKGTYWFDLEQSQIDNIKSADSVIAGVVRRELRISIEDDERFDHGSDDE